MKLPVLLVVIVALAVAVFAPPVEDELKLDLRQIDRAGNDLPCPEEFAHVVGPGRKQVTPWAFLQDFAYAATAAGPEGCGWLLGAVALVAALLGLWSFGFVGALRRMMLTFALGIPICLCLIYTSSFLEGRRIRLGPEAVGKYAAVSLHAQTDRTTGLLSPKDVVKWHYQRGFAVLNVSDRDQIRAGLEARDYAFAVGAPVLVLVGEEWHVHPDLVLINVKRARAARHQTNAELAETIASVHAEGGAVSLAHPWAKLSPRRLEDVLAAGVDAVEAVNGVIHGGSHVIEAAKQHKKALVGVIDYKYGPHVNALTLLDAQQARTPAGVVRSLREANTIVLYAVPGGTMTGAAWEAGNLGITGAFEGLRVLRETPLGRRAVWFAWLAGIAVLWWIGGFEPKLGIRNPVSKRVARTLFVVCCLLEYMIPAGISWEVREALGTIPVWLLLGIAGVVAVPLLASTRALAREDDA